MHDTVKASVSVLEGWPDHLRVAAVSLVGRTVRIFEGGHHANGIAGESWTLEWRLRIRSKDDAGVVSGRRVGCEWNNEAAQNAEAALRRGN